jgi:3alpha(or 20beta)-hydroxysteroid dehydrogenase
MAEARYQGQVAIVTGAAGGIGSAVVRRLVQDGARVAMVDRDERQLNEVSGQFASDSVLALTADVSQEPDVQRYVERTVEHFGRLDLLFNNAGVEGRVANIVDSEMADFDRLIGVNVRGVYLGLREVLRALRRQDQGGAIVNTASIAGLRGGAGLAPYIASKHAVVGLTRTAALEAAEFGVRVNAVAPGYIDTRMLRALHEARRPDDVQGARESMTRRVPLKRLGTPEDVANLVTWLLSSEAAYITGSVHLVDAGLTS